MGLTVYGVAALPKTPILRRLYQPKIGWQVCWGVGSSLRAVVPGLRHLKSTIGRLHWYYILNLKFDRSR